MNCLAIVLLVLCWMNTCPEAVDITDVDDHDPGSCDESNALQVYSVNDRNGEKKLWFCSDENGKYLWKPIDGEAHIGEFLHPGYDCSDILNKERDASDGFYWITLGVSTKRKVWCDMTTDGGGYMLVARKHDAIIWDVPSKDQPVEPDSSETYWTSQLGDAPILDLRIQLSTSDSLDDTKAHWSYRMNNTRTLENLMITDRGCEALSPGIGDIAYVNDLRAEKIVTTTFNCSVFGPNTASFIKIGWEKMNYCLKNPCGGSGYIDLPGQKPIKFEENGVFSYSVLNAKSGVVNDATAYIGCLHGTCCGCFGPAGGTANYCDTQCNPINGGTSIDPKNIYSWVWVRSSMPKRIWNRCMEYQSQDENGQLQWYTLMGDSVVAEKGRCYHADELRLNSGVVVVPDKATAQKVPGIPGLLEYRKDQKKLYVRANKTWNLLTQEKEVKGKLIELEESMDTRLQNLTEKIQSTNADLNGKLDTKYAELKGKIGNIEAADVDLKGKINSTYAELKQKIDAGDAELEEKSRLTVEDYDNAIEGCFHYTWLNESDRRYDHQDSSNQKCDNNLSGWYRFGGSAGTTMYTSCRSSQYYCSAARPGYLNGAHPALGDGIVSRTVCFYRYYYHYHGWRGSCCYESRSIDVINCDTYYVYKLNGVPSCNSRYCST